MKSGPGAQISFPRCVFSGTARSYAIYQPSSDAFHAFAWAPPARGHTKAPPGTFCVITPVAFSKKLHTHVSSSPPLPFRLLLLSVFSTFPLWSLSCVDLGQASRLTRFFLWVLRSHAAALQTVQSGKALPGREARRPCPVGTEGLRGYPTVFIESYYVLRSKFALTHVPVHPWQDTSRPNDWDCSQHVLRPARCSHPFTHCRLRHTDGVFRRTNSCLFFAFGGPESMVTTLAYVSLLPRFLASPYRYPHLSPLRLARTADGQGRKIISLHRQCFSCPHPNAVRLAGTQDCFSALMGPAGSNFVTLGPAPCPEAPFPWDCLKCNR